MRISVIILNIGLIHCSDISRYSRQIMYPHDQEGTKGEGMGSSPCCTVLVATMSLSLGVKERAVASFYSYWREIGLRTPLWKGRTIFWSCLSLNMGAQKIRFAWKSNFEKPKGRRDGSIFCVKVNQILQ